MIRYINTRIKSSIKRNYFNTAATGELEKLQNIIKNYPEVLNLQNTGGSDVLYYAMRNMRKNVCEYLLSNHPNHFKINKFVVLGLIRSDWSFTVESYLFLKWLLNKSDVNLDVEAEASIASYPNWKTYCKKMNNKEIWALMKFKESCIDQVELVKFDNILKLEKLDTPEVYKQIFIEFKLKKGSSTNPKVKSVFRDFNLKFLLND